MEETWEFAAVSEEENSEKFAWEWSSKHTRLRYQLVISSLLFASFCRFEAVTFKLPLSVADFSAKPAQWEFVFGFFLFYLFTLVSFYYRSRNERNSLDISESEFLKSTQKIRSTLDTFASMMTPASSESYQKILSAIDTAKNDSIDAVAKLKHENSLVNGAIKDIERVEKELKPILHVLQNISQWNERFKGFGEIHNQKQEFLNLSKIVDKLPPGFQFDSDIEVKLNLAISDIKQSRESSGDYQVYQEQFEELFENSVSEAKEFCKLEKGRFESLETRLSQADGFQIDKLRTVIDDLNSDAERRHDYKKIDREYLGFRLPIYTSALFILIGVWLISGPSNILGN